MIKRGGRTIYCEIHKLIYSILNKKEVSKEWKELIILPIYKKGDNTEIAVIGAYHFCQLHTKLYPKSCCQG